MCTGNEESLRYETKRKGRRLRRIVKWVFVGEVCQGGKWIEVAVGNAKYWTAATSSTFSKGQISSSSE